MASGSEQYKAVSAKGKKTAAKKRSAKRKKSKPAELGSIHFDGYYEDDDIPF